MGIDHPAYAAGIPAVDEATRTVMIEGKSGLLGIHMEGERPRYEPSKRLLTWPNGAMAICYAAEAPELLRDRKSVV